jgi:hypothetical protein
VIRVSIRDYCDWKTDAKAVDIGPIRLYFSYETCVAFHLDGHVLQVCENVWSNTTGRHLSVLDGGDKQSRLPYDEFQRQLAAAVESIHVGEQRPTQEIQLTVTARELATILAALRYWQGELSDNDGVDALENDIATDGGTLKPLTVEEIGALCERLNTEP